SVCCFSVLRSDAPPLARAASVVRNRGYVADRLDLDARRRQSADRRLAPRSGTAHLDVHRPDPEVLGGVAGALSRDLRREGRALARALESDAPRGRPAQRAALRIADRNDRVVEGRLDVCHPVRDDALLLLLGALLVLLAARGGCRC